MDHPVLGSSLVLPLAMTRALPPLAWLRTFEAAARRASFAAAAEELHLTPAAVSQHVRLLESWVGAALFRRQQRGLSLTEDGAALLPSVAGALDGLEAGLREAFAHRQQLFLTLRCSVSFGAMWLAPRLHAFQAAHPGIHVRILTEVWPSDDDGTGVDLEVRHGLGRWAGVACERLSVDVITPAMAPGQGATLAAAGAPWEDFLAAAQGLVSTVGYDKGWRAWLRAASLAEAAVDGALLVDSELIAACLADTG
ncbi:MAG: LysR family transcriptional regulator, partial [Candidatus Competibacterales bacterium]